MNVKRVAPDAYDIPGAWSIALPIAGGMTTGILILYLFGRPLGLWLRSFWRFAPIVALVGSLYTIILGAGKRLKVLGFAAGLGTCL